MTTRVSWRRIDHRNRKAIQTTTFDQTSMRFSTLMRRIPAPLVVAMAFLSIIVFGILLAYARSHLPSLEESCRMECSAQTKTMSWQLVPKYPRTMLPDGKNPPVVCKC